MLGKYKFVEKLYENPLSCEDNVKDFVLEGEAYRSFPRGRMRLENKMSMSEGQNSNYVFWCPKDFEGDIAISWRFWPIKEPGLAIIFFCAKGQNGEDIFDEALAKRTGPYKQYHHGDINAYHVGYFRRRFEVERNFHLINLRKSYGAHLVADGADPIPSVNDAKEEGYLITVIKCESKISFYVDELLIWTYEDDGETYGPVLNEGKIGFRQMAPLIAEYADLKVYRVITK
ncbi:DUF1961 family protein [Vallitalea sp.]|uniref:DUF1961 family protein n=1 Tax=Vallitalea sp. TaxID=1882829 RepID=UPI0025E0BFFB|nr:DUF1961 family protein [Vallitalea sp.]MCT4688831.1 YesU family protein [Vallitalea sp.]